MLFITFYDFGLCFNPVLPCHLMSPFLVLPFTCNSMPTLTVVHSVHYSWGQAYEGVHGVSFLLSLCDLI